MVRVGHAIPTGRATGRCSQASKLNVEQPKSESWGPLRRTQSILSRRRLDAGRFRPLKRTLRLCRQEARVAAAEFDNRWLGQCELLLDVGDLLPVEVDGAFLHLPN